MGLPDPAFYTRTDADTVALMGRYRNYVKQILALTGTPAAKLDAESQAVIALETELARNAQSLAAQQPRSTTTRRSPPRTSTAAIATCSWMRS
ncbi:hypothetical protein QT383_19885 [Stenotrophomonas rhizophila]